MEAPIHGNYHGYYSKRPSIRDPRLSLLPAELLSGMRVLDVGCNEGLVTCEIAQSGGADHVIGVDIDDTLIRLAWKRRRTAWSCQRPESVGIDKCIPVYKRRRVENDTSLPPDYFPQSFEHMFGALPIPSAGPDEKHCFPHNLTFRTGDWVKEPIPEDAEGYNVVIAFSITKWIHLNGGDEGIKAFFERVHKVLKTGGSFVLEPQAWDTYAKAKRMDDRLRENAKSLQLRPEQFDVLLKEIGFGPPQKLGSTGDGGKIIEACIPFQFTLTTSRLP
ncbi:hypothetical protein ONZ45_g16473 [Pleurotus djamor]|nr:hypothetical protein ONZ45_g16473 [Pleurotus djamor]